MKRILLAAAVLVCLVAVLTAAWLPPAARPPVAADFALSWPVARGAYHVHSRRSDGTGTLDEIAAAAAAAGLQFVIVTDHGDGTREPEPPTYRSGVLCLDGVEISTAEGHYVALGLARTPYPLAGHARDVIEDVARFGGFGVVAHPGSPKAELRWQDWEAPFDGLEWLNADSEWRDEFKGSLGRVLLTYPFRPAETLAGLFDRPIDVLTQWDKATGVRRVPALAGADAHARLGWGQVRDPYDDGVLARVPAYAVSFRAFTNHLLLDGPLTGDPRRDAQRVLDAVREGRIFSSIDGQAKLSALEVRATSGTAFARIGEYLEVTGSAAIEARIAAPAGTRLAVLRDGVPLYDAASSSIRVDVGRQPGAYRVEAQLPSAMSSSSVPWVLTNPIYVGLGETHARAAIAPEAPAATQRSGVATALWRGEASAGSTSTLSAATLPDGTPALQWRFTLAAGARGNQYAALLFPVAQGLSGHDRLQLRATSDAPRRVWTQIRTRAEDGGERWGRTFFVDGTLRALDLRFSEFHPIGPTAPARPQFDRIDAVLMVVDTLNSQPGASGTLWIPDLWLAK